MPFWLTIIIIATYVSGLFYLAWRGDKQNALTASQDTPKINGLIYALALAVYCTSWTYFGAVGTAASSGWDYIWIYAGPAFMFLVFPHIIKKIGDIAHRESITSLSDFLSARYGKSRGVAVLATLAAVMGSLPYIALQLKSVSVSFNTLIYNGENAAGSSHESVLLTALVMAAFAIFFGARHSDVTKHNHGLMQVLSFEAIFKLLALMSVCFLSFIIYEGDMSQITADAQSHFGQLTLSGRAVTTLLLSMAAIICLPRQFHIAMIERQNPEEVNWARWVFPFYLLLTSLVVIPITLAGLSIFPSSVSADIFVLQLPLSQGHSWLALFVFLGGFSAATAMIVVATIAISTMITSDIIVPSFIDKGQLRGISGDGGANLIFVRRLVIVGLLLLAYGYFRLAEDSTALAQMGLLSFAAAIQFAPALLFAIYWRRANRNGVIAGLSLGMLVWGFTLFLPAIIGADIQAAFVPELLNPQALFGVSFGDPLTHGVLWSLGLNIGFLILISLLSTERLRDRVQAVAFTAQDEHKIISGMAKGTSITTISPNGLSALASRFLDSQAVTHSFESFRKETNIKASGDGPADWHLVQHTEKLLARAIGASSARVIMSSAIGGSDIDFDDLLTVFDQKSNAKKFDQHMLQATLENIAQGMSVVDGGQKLVAWNGAYVEMFGYPPELIKAGTPIEDLIDYNIRSGWIISGNPTNEARRRVEHMRVGRPHIYERQNPDGRYLRIAGNPVPGGGYVTTFTDITEDKKREQALIEANETLEARVKDRTQALQNITDDLARSRQEAIGANASKTRFLAAASHDLLQPLNAARLFLGAVQTDSSNEALLKKADTAIRSADELLKGLLDISRLDHSTVEPKFTDIPLAPLFEDLTEEARPMTEKTGLKISFVPTRLSVKADPDFLQSIIRNFLSNARRYTLSGGILLGARRNADKVRIEVWDTGPGISKDKLDLIFEEFQRFQDVDNLGIRGAGLGLTVTRRMAHLMQTEIKVKSRLNKGSVFSVCLNRAKFSVQFQAHPVKRPRETSDHLIDLTVLCIDDEPTILEGMAALLSKWHCQVLTSADIKTALDIAAQTNIDVIIADYQLGLDENGLDALAQLRPFLNEPDNVCLLTARKTRAVETKAAKDNIKILNKPADPQDIKNFLLGCRVAGEPQ